MARDRPRAILIRCDCKEANVRIACELGLSNISNEVGRVKVLNAVIGNRVYPDRCCEQGLSLAISECDGN